MIFARYQYELKEYGILTNFYDIYHKLTELLKIKCKYCGIEFINQDELNRHYQYLHK